MIKYILENEKIYFCLSK